MFEREQLRSKLLEGRVEEMKLKQRTQRAESEAPIPEQKEPEEDLDPDNPEEFLRIIAADDEFREALNNFKDHVIKVVKKRQLRTYVMEKTDFENQRTSVNVLFERPDDEPGESAVD